MIFARNAHFILSALAAALPALAAAPSISSGGVVNGAGFVPGGIAQGSYISIFGTGLGPSPGVKAKAATAQSGYPTMLPASNGTSVTVDSGGNLFQCFITFASDLQVNAILPSTVPPGSASVTVSFNGATSPPEPIAVVSENFQVFAENAQGWGQASAQLVFPEPYLNNNITSPAIPTHFVAIYGTGLGMLPKGLADNVPTGATPVNFLKAPYNYQVSVKINGEMIPASFAGRSPLFPALDQINVKLPADVGLSCFTRGEVVITPGTDPTLVLTNAFTLATAGATGQSCPNLFGLNADALHKLQRGGTVNLGIAFLGTLNDVSPKAKPEDEPESIAGAIALSANKPAVFGLSSLLSSLAGFLGGLGWDPTELPPPGQCRTSDFLTLLQAPFAVIQNLGSLSGNQGDNSTFDAISQLYPGAKSTPLSAGPQLTLSGPGGSFPLTLDSSVTSATSYKFDNLPAGLFSGGGTWTLSAPGDSNGIGSFSVTFDVLPGVAWSNPPNGVAVPRDQNLAVAFSNPSGAPVVISGISLSDSSQPSSFLCNADANPFMVPKAVLQTLPATSGDQIGTLGVSVGKVVFVGNTTGLDGGVILDSSVARSDASFQ